MADEFGFCSEESDIGRASVIEQQKSWSGYTNAQMILVLVADFLTLQA